MIQCSFVQGLYIKNESTKICNDLNIEYRPSYKILHAALEQTLMVGERGAQICNS